MRDPIAVAFGRVLREQRDARGLSQEAMAQKADVDRTFISQIERGIRRATLTTLCKLSHGLDVAPSTLIARMERQLAADRGEPPALD
ncbi:MAG: helix-turn-helix domain-containing protein [Steroidobacteraceae bacterium]